MYDDKRIIEGNFTRRFSVYENDFLDDAIDVTVQNKMLPLGVNYLHRVNNDGHVVTSDSPNVVRCWRGSQCLARARAVRQPAD